MDEKLGVGGIRCMYRYYSSGTCQGHFRSLGAFFRELDRNAKM